MCSQGFRNFCVNKGTYGALKYYKCALLKCPLVAAMDGKLVKKQATVFNFRIYIYLRMRSLWMFIIVWKVQTVE
jgi:hypothetical protein